MKKEIPATVKDHNSKGGNMNFRIFSQALLMAYVVAITITAGDTEHSETECRHVPVNLSVVPDITTNGNNGSNTESNVTINIFAGSGRNLKGLELGGIMNMERENVSGAQFAGAVNLVQGDVKGFQSSGSANIIKGNVSGVQTAGTVNAAGSLWGTQFSGILNTVSGQAKGAQISGIANISGPSSDVAQICGIVNMMKNGRSAQFAGVTNLADEISGAQFSLVNIARKVDGAQIGLINIADEVHGAPIGLFSYVKSVGLHYQFFADESGFGNTAIRCGGNNVYSLLSIGLLRKFDSAMKNTLWSLGYGLGVRYDLNNRFYVNADMLAQFMHHRGSWDEKPNFITRYRAGGGYRVNGHFAIIGGLTGNTLFSREDTGSEYVPSWLSNAKKKGDTWYQMWPGVYLGVEL